MSSIDRPSQGVKTLKNNAIIIMTVIILMGRVERKPDVVAFEDLRQRKFSNSTGTTHYDSLQGSYWTDQRLIFIRGFMTSLQGAIKWSHEGIRYFLIKY